LPAGARAFSTPDTAPDAPNKNSNALHTMGLGNQVRELPLLRTVTAVETDGGMQSPAMCKLRNQTLRLSGQIVDLVDPDQLPQPAEDVPVLLPTPGASVGERGRETGQDPERRRMLGRQVELADIICFTLMPTPTVGMTMGGSEARSGDRNGEKLLPGVAKDLAELNGGQLLPTPDAYAGNRGGASDPDHRRANGRTVSLADATCFLPTPKASDGEKGGPNQRGSKGDRTMPSTAVALADESGIQWGVYEPAIRRWEAIMGPAPSPTEPNARGALRLSPRFTEWMMGQPAGWITDPAIGISSKDMLKACGNGVVTQQAVAALQDMLDSSTAMDPPERELPTPDGELPGQMSLLDGLEGTA
jgi:hypothetical protein